MRILGLSAFSRDSAAALIEDGRIIAAAEEERFSGRRRDGSFPSGAAAFCLRYAGLRLRDLDRIAMQGGARAETVPPADPRLQRALAALDPQIAGWAGVSVVPHEWCQVASAFYPSPSPEAAIVVVDGGSGIATVVASGRESVITLRHRLADPHSLALFAAAFTEFLGFRAGAGEQAMARLAADGQPRFRELITGGMVRWLDHGLFALNPCFLRFDGPSSLSTPMLRELLGLRPRLAEEPVRQPHRDLAASVQAVIGDVLVRLARTAADETGALDLCLGGAMALNPAVNGRLRREGGFRGIWVQPAAGEAAGAVGAALCVYHRDCTGARVYGPAIDGMAGGLLGPDFAEDEIETRLGRLGARYRRLSEDGMLDAVVDALAAGQIVGWFQERMEFGPHALGARALLADPAHPHLSRFLDRFTPPREAVRPIVAAVPSTAAADWFALEGDSPYGLFTAPVREQRAGRIAAAIAADGTARVQTVDARSQPLFHRLLCRFQNATGCPVLLQTGFGLGEAPGVATPEDAFGWLTTTAIDMLACGRCVLRRDEQTPAIGGGGRRFDPV